LNPGCVGWEKLKGNKVVVLLDAALILFFPFLMAFAAASDLVSMTISNKITLGLVAGFAIFAFAIGMPLSDMGSHWLMFAIVLAIGFALFSFGVIGGGDAKLAAAIALWLGGENLLLYFAYAALCGGALTLVLLKLRSVPLPARFSNVGWIARLYRADEGVPYGIALAAAALIVYPQTPWMQHVFSTARGIGG
jgi:prepilin peptidase CpaA